MNSDTITIEQAYFAMFNYLENLYFMTDSDDLAGFLGSMAIQSDGLPADSAVWQDWKKAIEKTKETTRFS